MGQAFNDGESLVSLGERYGKSPKAISRILCRAREELGLIIEYRYGFRSKSATVEQEEMV